MLQFLLHDPETLLHGNETISLDGVDLGHVQVGAYGHSLGGAVGIGFVERDAPLAAEAVDACRWEIDVAGNRIPLSASLKPLLDQAMKQIRC